MTTALVIHGHFYQPPRENPWTGLVEREPGAQPFHDWNERIHAECYRPNGYARVVDPYGRVERVVNNYRNLSFNFGPTLLAWLERRHPETYARVVAADRESAALRGGHGNAIAQGFNHAILPLCNERDRRTQVRWGVSDFRRRFRREPASLWLPETACDRATLDTLVEEGLRYVILSPQQAARVRPAGGAEWAGVSGGRVDTSVPYKYLHQDGGGRSLAVFFYDGLLARAVAFEGLLASSHALVERCLRASAGGRAPLVHLATDGESYGHHFRWGDRCLAYALEEEAARRGLRVTNYGEFLDEYGEPRFEVEIDEGPDGRGSAWSCAHGVGRWSRDCGCHAGAPEGWDQRWRAPLRAALDLLRDAAAARFEEDGRRLLGDPWAARDAYVDLINAADSEQEAARAAFFDRHAARPLSGAERVRALTLLEMQRCALTMYTSCGWFFNDISGLEAVQVLRYAGRCVELLGELGLDPPVEEFLETLAGARSNVAEKGTGADVFLRAVEHSRVTPARVAAHLAICDLVERGAEDASCESAGYHLRKSETERRRHGRVTLETGRLALEERATARPFEFAFAAMHFGELDYYCALRPLAGEEAFRESAARLWSQFRTASLPALLRTALAEFGPAEFGLEALLPEGQGQLSRSVFGRLVGRFMEEYEHLYAESRRTIERLQEIGFHPPRELRAAAELTLGRRLEAELRRQREGAGDYRAAVELAAEASRAGYRIDRAAFKRVYEETLTEAARAAAESPAPGRLRAAHALLALGRELNLGADIERAQEVVYEAAQAGPPLPEDLRDFALALGLSPVALARAPGADEAGEAGATDEAPLELRGADV